MVEHTCAANSACNDPRQFRITFLAFNGSSIVALM